MPLPLNNQALIGVVLSFYAFIAIGIAEGGLGVLIPSIEATYNLNSATISLLFLTQVTGYIFAALASSILSQHLGLARMLLLAASSLTCALIIYAFSPFWWVMVAAGTLLGLGIGLIDAGINTYIAKQQSHADLMGMLHAFYGIGALLGPAVATTLLALKFSWRSVYLVIAAVVSLTVVGMLWACVFDYKPMNMRSRNSNTSARANIQAALTNQTVLLAGILLLVYVGTEASIGNWAYSVQTISRDTPEILAGYSVSAYWMGLTLGRGVTGRIVNYLGAIRTLDCALILLLIGLISWWLFPQQLLSLPIIGLALAPIFPLTIWLMPQRLPTAIVPAAIGFMTSIASLGAAMIPSSVGWISARLGVGIVPIMMIPLAVVMLILHRGVVLRSRPQ